MEKKKRKEKHEWVKVGEHRRTGADKTEEKKNTGKK